MTVIVSFGYPIPASRATQTFRAQHGTQRWSKFHRADIAMVVDAPEVLMLTQNAVEDCSVAS
ncbi:MAG TPA: hypothetical protein VGK05_04190 [Acidimicrobiia bacterium]